MKKLAFILLLMLTLGSCRKHWEQIPASSEVLQMEDLKVNDGFNWKLSREMIIDGKYLSGGGTVEVTTADQSITFYNGYADGKSISLSIPTWVDEVYINGVSYSQLVSNKSTPFKSSIAFTYDPPAIFFNQGTHLQAGVRINDQTFLLFYVNGNQNNSLYYMVGTINGNAITYGNPIKIGVEGATMLRVIQYEPNKVLIGYTSSSGGNNNRVYLLKASFNGTQLTNYFATFATETASHFDIAAFSDKKAVITYVLMSNNILYARMIDLMDNVPFTLGNPQSIATMQSQTSYMLNVTTLGNSYFVVGNYLNSGNRPRFAYVNRSGLNINPLIPQYELASIPVSQRNSAILKINDSRALFFYYKGSDTYCRFVNFSGNMVSLAQENLVLNTQLKNLGVSVIDDEYIHLVATNPLDNYQLNFSHASIAGDVVSFEPFYSTGIPYNFSYYTQNPPVTNFAMGNNTHLIIACYAMSNRNGITFLGHHQPAIPDADHDGIADADDAYPNDPLRAFDNYFPASGFGSLAFEDLWPGKGDYDFNDVVVDYRFHTVSNAQNKVVEINARFVSKASGASLENGFGFQLTNASNDLNSGPTNFKFTTTGCRLFEDFIHLNAPGDEYGQHKPTIIVYDNFFRIMPNPGTGLGVNTVQDQGFVAFDTTTIVITPTQPTFSLDDFAIHSWNPFIIVNKVRGHEVHLPDFLPTDFANPDLFGKWEDDSRLSTGRTYKTVQNLPWAIDIPYRFDWPTEKTDVTQAHLKFAEWTQSGGVAFPDWYLDQPGYRNEANIYQLPE